MENKQDKEAEKILYVIGWIILGCIIVGVGLYYIFHINILNLLPPCIFYNKYGLYCPGCGGTRSITSLLNGKLIQSFFYHPIILYSIVIGGYYMVSHSLSYLTSGKIRGMKFRIIYIILFVVLMLLNFAFKNILIYLKIII